VLINPHCLNELTDFENLEGLGSGLAKNPSWAKAFTGNNVGGLIVAAYEPLGAYGKFCAVIV